MVMCHLRQALRFAVQVCPTISHIDNICSNIQHQCSGYRRSHLNTRLLAVVPDGYIRLLDTIGEDFYEQLSTELIALGDALQNRLCHDLYSHMTGLLPISMAPHPIGDY